MPLVHLIPSPRIPPARLLRNLEVREDPVRSVDGLLTLVVMDQPTVRVTAVSGGVGSAAGPAPVDAKLRAQTEMILAMPVADRLRQLEAEANFFASVRPLTD